MTIDRAIEKYKDLAQDDCTDYDVSEEYEQIVELLEELKAYRDNDGMSENVYKAGHKTGYIKAIDDFVDKMKKYMETTGQSIYIDEINKGNDNYSAMTIYDDVDKIAEQLKESDNSVNHEQ